MKKDEAAKLVFIYYDLLLHRKPDAIGLKVWTDKLVEDKNFTEIDLVYALMTSAEYQKLIKLKEDGLRK